MQAMVGFWVCWFKLVASWRQILNGGLLNVGAVGGVCGSKKQQNAVVLPFDRRQTLAKSRRGPVVERFDVYVSIFCAQ